MGTGIAMNIFSKKPFSKTESRDDIPQERTHSTAKGAGFDLGGLLGRKTTVSSANRRRVQDNAEDDIRIYNPKHSSEEDFSDYPSESELYAEPQYSENAYSDSFDFNFDEPTVRKSSDFSFDFDLGFDIDTSVSTAKRSVDTLTYELDINLSNDESNYSDEETEDPNIYADEKTYDDSYGEGLDYLDHASIEPYEGSDYSDYSDDDGIDYSDYDSYTAVSNSASSNDTQEEQERSSAINDTQQEARRYIAELQAAAQKAIEEYDPLLDGLDADPSAFSYQTDELFTPLASDEPEIDSRFNLSGKREQTDMHYGGYTVDQSADESYVQKPQTAYNPTQWTKDYDDPSNETEDDPNAGRKKRRLTKRQQKKLEKEELARKAAQQAEQSDYDSEDDDEEHDDALNEDEYYDDEDGYAEEEKNFEEEDFYFPPSFREYVLSLFASVFLRLRGTNTKLNSDTMVDVAEDLGEEVSPLAATKYYCSFTKSMGLRLKINAVLLAMLLYISLQLPLPGMLRTVKVSALACFALQSGIMLLCLDTVTTAMLNAFNRRFGADTLAVLACFISGSDALLSALADTSAPHMPVCAITSLALVGIVVSAYINVKALRKATRVPAIGKHFYSVTGELKLDERSLSLLKSQRGAKGFVRRAEELPPDESMTRRISPILLLLSMLLSLIVGIKYNCYSELIYILSVHLALSVPLAALTAFALPYLMGTQRVFRVGASIAGWSGLCDLGMSKNLIVTDRDLFPEECITMENVRIFADGDALDVISYAGSLIAATGACSSACFMQLMEENDCKTKKIDGFECLPGGGARGIIDGHTVLCGSTDLMRLMNIRIPFRLTDKTSILLAIDGILYGIFSLHYEPHPQVRRALMELVRSNRHPVFAIRDFNINPEMLHNTYDIATDGYDFPPYVERFELTAPSEKTGRIAAIVCNEGLSPLTEVADVGRRMYLAIRTNLVITTLYAIFGVFMVFFRFMNLGSVSLSFLFFFAIFGLVPILPVSLYVNTR